MSFRNSFRNIYIFKKGPEYVYYHDLMSRMTKQLPLIEFINEVILSDKIHENINDFISNNDFIEFYGTNDKGHNAATELLIKSFPFIKSKWLNQTIEGQDTDTHNMDIMACISQWIEILLNNNANLEAIANDFTRDELDKLFRYQGMEELKIRHYYNDDMAYLIQDRYRACSRQYSILVEGLLSGISSSDKVGERLYKEMFKEVEKGNRLLFIVLDQHKFQNIMFDCAAL